MAKSRIKFFSLLLAVTAAAAPLGGAAASLSPDKQDWLEASQTLEQQGRTQLNDVDVEIVEVTATEGKLELRLRAWDIYGDQIGFGTDGSVDLERFRFVGPLPQYVTDYGQLPKMTEDEFGNWYSKYPEVYDPHQALNEQLSHTIQTVSRFGPSAIVAGKEGFTVTTVYPDLHPESTSVDGRTYHYSVNQDWSTIRDGAGTNSQDDNTVINLGNIHAGSTTDKWSNLYRSFLLFDTSAIADADIIRTATLSFYGEAKTDTLNAAPEYNLYSASPASNTAIVAGDYDSCGTVALSDDNVTFAEFDTAGYNDWLLNASGVAVIDATGISKFCTRDAIYDVTDTPPTWSDSNHFTAWGKSADVGSDKPKLVIEHSAENTCGDGWIDGGEACDDGDTDNGDGCSSTCTVESGWECTEEPSVCTETGGFTWEVAEPMNSTDKAAGVVLLIGVAIFLGVGLINLSRRRK